MAKKGKNKNKTLEEKVEPIRVAKKILVAEDMRRIEDIFGATLHSLSRYGIDLTVSYVRPSRALTKRRLSSRKPDMVMTSTRDSYGYVLDRTKNYNPQIPVLVIVNDCLNKIEIDYAVEHGAACVFGPRGSSNYLVETIARILKGEAVEKMTGFEKPRAPAFKTGPSVVGFSRKGMTGQSCPVTDWPYD